MTLFWIVVVKNLTTGSVEIVVAPKAILAKDEGHARMLAGRMIPLSDDTPDKLLEVMVSPF